MFDKSFVPHFTRHIHTLNGQRHQHFVALSCQFVLNVDTKWLWLVSPYLWIQLIVHSGVRIDGVTTTMKRQQQQRQQQNIRENVQIKYISPCAPQHIANGICGVSECLKHTSAAAAVAVATIYSTNICRQWMACVETIHLNDSDCVCFCQC